MEAIGKTIVWIDETNFNLFCTRQYGRSVKGSPVRVAASNCRGKNLHIIGAINAGGLVKYTLKRGSFTAELCRLWMKDLLDELALSTNDSFVIVCDNAPCHSRLESLFTDNRFQLVRLGPYSPSLNPIEIVWSVLKGEIRRDMTETYGTILQGDPENRLNKGEWRIQQLELIADRAKACITGSLCNNAIRHVRGVYDLVLSGQEI
ncbi:MAG: transposase [Candidatus Thiodiazotropha sp.]